MSCGSALAWHGSTEAQRLGRFAVEAGLLTDREGLGWRGRLRKGRRGNTIITISALRPSRLRRCGGDPARHLHTTGHGLEPPRCNVAQARLALALPLGIRGGATLLLLSGGRRAAMCGPLAASAFKSLGLGPRTGLATSCVRQKGTHTSHPPLCSRPSREHRPTWRASRRAAQGRWPQRAASFCFL